MWRCMRLIVHPRCQGAKIGMNEKIPIQFSLTITKCAHSRAPRFHWAILTGPKIEKPGRDGTRHHAKDGARNTGERFWYYAWNRIPLNSTAHLLVRIMVGKIVDEKRLLDVLSKVPIVHEDWSWNCVIWVKHALEALQADGRAVGTAVLDWNVVRDKALAYHREKLAQGRLKEVGMLNRAPSPTYDLLRGEETIP